jgi:aspartate racemase
MEGPVYPPKFAARAVELLIPDAPARARINQITFDELVYGRCEDHARQYFSSVIDELGRRGCDAVALSWTEFPLLIAQRDSIPGIR